MNKLTLISLVLLGLVLWAGYAMQGSYVDEDGILQEPFHLLALAWLFTLAGGIILTGMLVVKIVKRWRTPK